MNRFLIIALIAAAVAFGLTRCEDEPSDLGLNVQPGDDNLKVKVTDTVTVTAHAIRLDSIRSDEAEFSMIGSYNDPVFGATTASFYTGVNLPTADHDFGENAQADSLVLGLAYKDHYGDTITSQQISVYELTQKIERDSVYFSNQTFDYDNSEDLANGFTFVPNPDDSVLVDTTMTAPHIRIQLSNTLANKLINAEQGDMSDAESFAEFFKGLYIKAAKVEQQGAGAISSIGMSAALTKLSLYYHNDTADSLTYDYQLTANTARVNHFEHYGYEEASSTLKQQIIDGDTALGMETVYAQAMAGVQTIIRFPYITDLKEKIAINDAKLYLPAQENSDIFGPPDQFDLFIKQSEGVLPLSDSNEGDAYFGGFYDNKNKRYEFRISKYLQSVIRGVVDSKTLLLTIPKSMASAERVVLNGPGNDENKMRLNIVYTEVE